MSNDNVHGWEIVPKNKANFEGNLSAKDIISRHTSKAERGLFIL